MTDIENRHRLEEPETRILPGGGGGSTKAERKANGRPPSNHSNAKKELGRTPKAYCKGTASRPKK